MRVTVHVASEDVTYIRCISEYISQHYTDYIEVSVSNNANQLNNALSGKRYDAALIDEVFAQTADTEMISLPLFLWTGESAGSIPQSAGYINKYKRISSTIASILEQLSAAAGETRQADVSKGNITAVWSPCGGTGKTTTALAFAASKAMQGQKVFYLNLENFASTPAYFGRSGKSISEVFEMLDSNESNMSMFIQGICGCDDGINYLSMPNNYEDVCILTRGNILKLVTECAATTGELIIDMSSRCDETSRQIFELADEVFLITETTETAHAKLSQFTTQNNVYGLIKDKTVIVENKSNISTQADCIEAADAGISGKTVYLPFIQSDDERCIYKTLARKIPAVLHARNL